MNYYRLRNSLVRDDVGHYPQASEIEYHCTQWYPAGSIIPTLNSASGIEPVTKVFLHPKAKVTDFISVMPPHAHERILVSTKLKDIIEKHINGGIRFNPAELYAGAAIVSGYWLMKVYELNMEYIDFGNSEILLRRQAENYKTVVQQVSIDGLQRFLHLIFVERPYGDLFLNKIQIKSNTTKHLFKVHHTENGWDLLISETLRDAMADHCTGLEFQPASASLKHWLSLNYSAAQDQIIPS